MSRENVEVVRQPITLQAHPHRRLEERLGLRFPRLFALVARAVRRLPMRSRLRQVVLRRAVRLGFEATNRRDIEAALMLHHPEIEYVNFPGAGGLGFQERSRGLSERIRFQREWNAEWEDLRFEVKRVIDLPDQVLILTYANARGLSSGVPVGTEVAFLLTVSGGRVVREQIFFDSSEALQAAGLSE